MIKPINMIYAIACGVLLLGCVKQPIQTIAKDVAHYSQDARSYLAISHSSTLSSIALASASSTPHQSPLESSNINRGLSSSLDMEDNLMQALDMLAGASTPTSNTPPQTHNASIHNIQEAYLQAYFSPWHIAPDSNIDNVFWVKGSLLKSPGFGENRLPNTKAFTQSLLDAMDIAHYPSAATKAIITQSTNVRVVPSEKMRFVTEDDFPFDTWQNSWIFVNTPVLITHYDTSKQWAHIESGFVSGWVLRAHIGVINETDIARLKRARYILPNRDNVPLYHQGSFLEYARIGQILPMDNGAVLVAVRDRDGYAHLQESSIAQEDILGDFPIRFSQEHVATMINSMIGEKYGWGGYLANRDCSAFIRDVFANYGLYLPRNSRAQAHVKKSMYSLAGLSRAQKERAIIEQGVPFGSVLYLKGHIMLYIGTYEGQIMVAHSAWSVKTSTLFRRYKNMLGGVVITSLYAGKEHSGIFSKTLLIDRIEGITNFYNLLYPHG